MMLLVLYKVFVKLLLLLLLLLDDRCAATTKLENSPKMAIPIQRISDNRLLNDDDFESFCCWWWAVGAKKKKNRFGGGEEPKINSISVEANRWDRRETAGGRRWLFVGAQNLICDHITIF
eukprot:scaffold178_cov163-Amphora_coffeaeformis.AAC.13